MSRCLRRRSGALLAEIGEHGHVVRIGDRHRDGLRSRVGAVVRRHLHHIGVVGVGIGRALEVRRRCEHQIAAADRELRLVGPARDRECRRVRPHRVRVGRGQRRHQRRVLGHRLCCVGRDRRRVVVQVGDRDRNRLGGDRVHAVVHVHDDVVDVVAARIQRHLVVRGRIERHRAARRDAEQRRVRAGQRIGHPSRPCRDR